VDQTQLSTYVAAQGHRLWTVFLAGQVADQKGGGYIVFECFDCAIEHAREMDVPQQWKKDAGAIFIGFGGQSRENSQLQLVHRQAAHPK
jgi:hypothetical protein